jgi:transcriptional regulator with XRE-family HTH domain
MPTAKELPDRAGFAERLNACLVAFGYGERGGDARLAMEFGVKPPVVSAWRSGRHLPAIGKVRRMAQEWSVPVDWLYWGEGAPPPNIGAAAPLYGRSRGTLVKQTESAIDELRLIVGTFAAVMAAKRPAEGEAVARALRRHAPRAKEGLVAEVLAILETPARS